MLIRQGFRYRLREKGSLAAAFRRNTGACRFVWNRALAHQNEANKQTGKLPGYGALCALLPVWKIEFPWLADAPSQVLQQTLKDLMGAWDKFFGDIKKGSRVAPDDAGLRWSLKKSGVKLAYRPRFKRRGDKDGMRFPQGFEIDEANARIKLPKLGWIRYRKSRELIGTPKNVTIALDTIGWHVSIQTERDDQLPCAATKIGAGDRGVTDFMVTADSRGDSRHIAPINALKKASAGLKRYQRAAARKIEAAKVAAGIPKDAPFPKGFKLKKSNRLKRSLGRLAGHQSKIARVRLDWLHKLSTGLANEYAAFCLEDLKTVNMTASARGTEETPGRKVSQKSGLNRSILDQGWGLFAGLMGYKIEWRGNRVILVPPHYTSQKCSRCGHTHPDNRDEKKFECGICGFKSDADLNAALNILAAGHAVLSGEAATHSGHADVEDTALSGRPVKRQSARTEGGAVCAA
jgi:putative transposase